MNHFPNARLQFNFSKNLPLAVWFIFSGCLMLSFSPPTRAQQSSGAESSPAGKGAEGEAPAAAVMPAFDQLRLDGFDALFSLEYAEAEKKFRRMIELDPDHPSGYVSLANCMWLRKLYTSRRLQTDLYATKSFYAESEEKADPEFDKAFRETLKLAMTKSEGRLKKNKKDAVALYYLGSAHGLLAAYEATVMRSFVAALRNGSKSVDYHEKTLEADPTYIDAKLTLGVYNYVVGSLPAPVKLLALMGGVKGSKKKGFELLEEARDHSRFVKDESRTMLIALYKRENRMEDALRELAILAEKYPRNYLIQLEQATTLAKAGKAESSNQVFSTLLENQTASGIRDVINFQFAESLLVQGNQAEALKRYQRVIHTPKANGDLITLSHLKSGQLYDLANDRQKALGQYRLVSLRRNVFDSREQAKKYLKTPYSAQD